jgi:hypothetical protein
MSAPPLGFDARPARDEETSAGWRAIGAIGLTLLAAGLVDLALAWSPMRFGSPEWEFGTISATLNNLPVPTMGLALLAAHGAAIDRKGQLLAVGLWAAAMAGMLVVAAAFYALDVPLALRAVQEPVARGSLKTGIVKGVASIVVYLGFHAWAAVFAFRRLRRT